MALAVGANQVQREMVIAALRGGASWKDATADLRKLVEQDWFDANEKHLQELAGVAKPAAPEAHPDTKKK